MQELINAVVDAAQDKKAQNPVILDIRDISIVTDYFIICHGNSEVQVQAIAKSIHERVEKEGLSPKKMEGYNEARWVLIDLDDVVVHVFHKEEREFYNLEKLWSDATQVHANEG